MIKTYNLLSVKVKKRKVNADAQNVSHCSGQYRIITISIGRKSYE